MHPSVPFSRQQRITNTLLLNASFIDNLGLMHGKVGIAIYFFHLARETENKMYEEYAGELIDEIYDEIYAGTPIDFENGLAGIGWGIEYLVQNKFIDADTNEVLEEFDNRIIDEVTFQTSSDFGILNGICGYILYYLNRLNSNTSGTSHFESIQKSLEIVLGLLNLGINNYLVDNDSNVLFDEPDQFDITWKYSAMIWTLAEMIESQVCVKVAEPLLGKLISPITNEGLFPKLHSHRLMLAMELEKLKQARSETLKDIDLEKIIQNLLFGIDRHEILIELADKSVFLRNGTSGISLIYKQLFLLTKQLFFNDEAEYWNQFDMKMPESDEGDARIFLYRKDEKTAYGILNGLAGINLFTNGKS